MFHNAKRLFPNDIVLDVDNDANDPLLRSSYVRQKWGKWDWPLVLSSSERAILELLDELPERETFHQADMLFEGLCNLSPRRLQPLLQACRSVKVKRLFLWFAERHRAASAAVAQCARPWRDRPGKRQAHASQRRQARPAIQYHSPGAARWQSLTDTANRSLC